MAGKAKRKPTPKSKKSKRSRDYELLSRDVLERLLEKRKSPAQVVHDVHLPTKARDEDGKRLKRQVDVFANYEDKAKRPLVVQAKGWKPSQPVSLPVVDSLSGMLSTLSKKCDGMLITSSRFQSGTIPIANANRLELCVLRKIQKSDLQPERSLPKISSTLTMIGRTATGLMFRMDQNLSSDERHELEISNLEDIELSDDAGAVLGSFEQIIECVFGLLGREAALAERHYAFNKPLFLRCGSMKRVVRIYAFKAKFQERIIVHSRLANSFTHYFESVTHHDKYLVDQHRSLVSLGDPLTAETPWINMERLFPEWFEAK